MNTDLTPDRDLLITHRFGEPGLYMRPERQQAHPHFHYQYELLFCLGGSAVFHVAGKEYAVRRGAMLFISNMENHYILSRDDDFDRYTLRFSGETAGMMRNPLLLSIFRQRPEGFVHLIECRERDIRAYQRLFLTMEKEYERQKPCWSQMLISYLLVILSNLYRQHAASFPAYRHPEGQLLIFRVQSYIENHLDADLGLEAVADRFFVDKFHLSHQFTRFTGYSFKQFIITARLSKAKDMLLHTDEEIRAVAQSVGYNSPAHFIRAFKKTEGLSPLQYRLRQRRI